MGNCAKSSDNTLNCKRCKDGEATYCIGCMNEIMAETDRALERAEARIASLRAAVEVAEKAHENCIDELMEAHEESKKLRAALFCKECGGKKYEVFYYNPFACQYQWEVIRAQSKHRAIKVFWDKYPHHKEHIERVMPIAPCPTCGPLRNELKEEE